MTFRIVDLITRLDGTRQRVYRMCDASGGEPCAHVSDPPPADNTIGCPKDKAPEEDGNDQGQGGGGASRQGDKDWDNTRPSACGGGNTSLSMLQDQLRRSLQEPPASPW